MAIVNQVNKKVKMSKTDIIKYQILTHCYLEKITVSDADLDCLTLLALNGEQDLSMFCQKAFELNIFKSTQTVRNALAKIETKNLIFKSGRSKKRIGVNINLNLQTQGNILLDYKFVSLENAS